MAVNVKPIVITRPDIILDMVKISIKIVANVVKESPTSVEPVIRIVQGHKISTKENLVIAIKVAATVVGPTSPTTGRGPESAAT